METVTVNEGQPATAATPQAPKTNHHFRVVFFILLLAVLASAVASTYLLIGLSAPAKIAETPVENPFDTIATYSNPFNEDSSAAAVANPFDESLETSANPFNQFADETVTQSDSYQNPF